VEAVKANARRLGGSFAVWGGLFSTFDCCFLALRNKEDPYNSIVSSPTPARATF
jgi:import inner membrane translocase subunit TIM17